MLLLIVILPACDPAHIVRMEANQYNHKGLPVTEIVKDIAKKYGLALSPVQRQGQINYSRNWDAKKNDHPKEIFLTITMSQSQDTWDIEIHEWLMFLQSNFGAKLEEEIKNTLQNNGYKVKEK